MNRSHENSGVHRFEYKDRVHDIYQYLSREFEQLRQQEIECFEKYPYRSRLISHRGLDQSFLDYANGDKKLCVETIDMNI